MIAQTVELATIAEVRLGRQRSPKDHVGPLMRPYLRAANVGWSGLDLADVKTMNFSDEEMQVFSLNAGDLLLSEASGSPGEVGKPALWHGELPVCAFQNTLIRVRPGPTVDPQYLLHYFKHQAVTGAFARGSRGVGIHHLGHAALARWPVPLPTLEEQRRVAAVLDRVETVQADRRRTVDNLVRLTQSIFFDMFGDPMQGGSDPTALSAVASVQTGPFGSLLHREDYVVGGVPIVNPMHISGGKIKPHADYSVTEAKRDELKSYQLLAGDVVLGRRGEMGRCAIVEKNQEGWLCGTGSLIVRPTRALAPQFLQAFLSQPSTKRALEHRSLGATLPNLNATIVSQLPLRVPPRSEQDVFCLRTGEVGRYETRAKLHLSRLDALVAAMQQRAFTGRSRSSL